MASLNIQLTAHHFSLVGILLLVLCAIANGQLQDSKNDTLVLSSYSNDSLVVSSYLEDPFLIQVSPEDSPDGPEYAGYIKDLLDELSTLTNREFTLVINEDNHPGRRLPNKTWAGVVGDVIYKKAHLGAGAITETARRRKYVDFSTPFMTFGPVVIMRRPQKHFMSLEERFRRLFMPLSASVWLMSGLAWFVTSVVLYIICYVDPYDWRKLMRDRQATLREGEAFTCLNTFWFTTSTSLWQGYTRGPRSLGGRIVVTLWWLYILIFIVMYIASMTNYLRQGPPAKNPIDSYSYIQKIEDLFTQSRISYGALANGSTQQMLRTMKVPRFMPKSPTVNQLQSTVSTIQQGIGQVRNSTGFGVNNKAYALVAESAMAKYHTMKEPCDLYMVGDMTTTGSYAMVLPLGAPYLTAIDLGLLALRESGKLRQLENKWFSGECTDFIMDSSSSSKINMQPFYEVDLASFSGALILLGLGLVLGAIVTGLEVIVFKYAESGNKSKDRKPLNSSSPDHGKGTHYTPASAMEPITDV